MTYNSHSCATHAGFLVDHCRLGTGKALQLHFRAQPFQEVHPFGATTSEQNAGTMLITRHELPDALELWHDKIIPGFKRFNRVLQLLLNDEKRLSEFLGAADKKGWFDAAVGGAAENGEVHADLAAMKVHD